MIRRAQLGRLQVSGVLQGQRCATRSCAVLPLSAVTSFSIHLDVSASKFLVGVALARYARRYTAEVLFRTTATLAFGSVCSTQDTLIRYIRRA